MSSLIKTKNTIFFTAVTITGITLISFVMVNYKYNNFLLTNVNMIYIASLILGLVVAYLAYGSPAKVQSEDEFDKILANKYIKIYKLVFELLTLDAIIANNRTNALRKLLPAEKDVVATIENINLNMNKLITLKEINVFTGNKDSKDSKQVIIKLNALSKKFVVIKTALDTNIIVALQLIYDLDTQNPVYSTTILDRAHGEAIQYLSSLDVSKITPDNEDKYFNTDVYEEDYKVLISKNEELDKALSDFLGKTTQQEYEKIAYGFKTNQNLSNNNQFITKKALVKMLDKEGAFNKRKIEISNKLFPTRVPTEDEKEMIKETLLNDILTQLSKDDKRSFKDLVSQTFNSSSETGGIYRFMDILYDIINEMKEAN